MYEGDVAALECNILITFHFGNYQVLSGVLPGDEYRSVENINIGNKVHCLFPRSVCSPFLYTVPIVA